MCLHQWQYQECQFSVGTSIKNVVNILSYLTITGGGIPFLKKCYSCLRHTVQKVQWSLEVFLHGTCRKEKRQIFKKIQGAYVNCTKDMYLCICEVPRSPLNRLSVWLFQTLFLFCSDPEFARALYISLG